MIQELRVMPKFSWRRLLIDSSWINSALGALIVGSLRLNAEMWVHNYPPDIQEAFGRKSKQTQRQTWLVAIPFFTILVGGAIWSNWRLRQEKNGRLTLGATFWHTYALFAAFFLFDLIILDWLFFVTFKPDFVVLPGTEGMAGYDDYLFHLRVSLPALPLMAVPAFMIALFMKRFP